MSAAASNMYADAKQDLRHKYLFDRIKDFFTVGEQTATEKFMLAHMDRFGEGTEITSIVSNFLQGTGASSLVFTYQPEGDNQLDDVLRAWEPSKLHELNPKKRFVFCVRPNTGKAIQNRDTAQLITDVFMGTLDPNVVDSFISLLSNVYAPILERMHKWGKNTDTERDSFLAHLNRFADNLTDLQKTSEDGVELQKVDDKVYASLSQTPSSKGSRGADPGALRSLQATVDSWIGTIDRIVNDESFYEPTAKEANNENSGPRDELEKWKKRLAKLTLIEQQLDEAQGPRAIQMLRDTKSSGALQRWSQIDAVLAERINEAKENVKYLSSLEKFFDVLYLGTPRQILATLPALINNIKMMYTIARYYSTESRMTALLFKVTNQMIMSCKYAINSSQADFSSQMRRIWELGEKPETLRKLIEDLQSCIILNKAYHDEFDKAEIDLQTKNPRGKQFQFDRLKIFGHFDLFAKRVDKLIGVFRTVEQFKLLKSYNIDQMEMLITRFDEHLKSLKDKTGDVLDIHDNNKFDAEYKVFDTNIAVLETSLQVTINSAFENITSTDNALNLLKKFQTILQTETFKSDLDSKYMVIFHNYGLELENDQKLYEKEKDRPPLVRNITPVAGRITWARQLLRHIKGPMDKFSVNDSIMKNQKESRKILRTYNKVLSALVEYEVIYADAWRRSIKSARAGLNATLLVRDEKGRLHVNFDIEILQLCKETRNILRLGEIDIPAPARMVLMQENKLKVYANELTFLVREYERAVGRGDDPESKVFTLVRPIMQPNIDALDAAIRPGETTLTWMSLNIDAYLQRAHEAVKRLDSMMSKVHDVISNRITANLVLMSNTLLVQLFDDHFSLEQFVSVQEKHIREQSTIMDIKNKEIQVAVDDVINTVMAHQEGSGIEVPRDKITMMRTLFNRLVFRAILNATTRSLNLIKKRVGTRNRVAFMFVDKPFFDVNVQLVNYDPYVTLNPSLEEVQKAINQSATAVLSCSKYMTPWADMSEAHASFFEEIAKNKEIVKVVLLLTGGIHGLKKQVMEYLNHFKKYEYLWKEDKEVEYQKFLATNPGLEEFEAALGRFVQLEKEIDEATSTYNIGSLSLNTEPLKAELRKKAAEWKDQYARNLHAQASRRLETVYGQIEEDQRQMSQQIPDQDKLEDLRVMMNTLKSIRERESEIDFIFNPVQDMYGLLQRYKVNVSKEEQDRVFELRYKWRSLRGLSESRTDEINNLQHGFKKGLLQEVQKFGVEVLTFRNDYEVNGPNVEGLKPDDAMERLKRYQRQYDDKERKWMTYMAGEDLFGIDKHLYPELVKTKKELDVLDKLYTLYINVLQKVRGYNDILWAELDFDKVAEEVTIFNNQCKRLPKAVRERDAYNVLKKILDDFIELQPMIKELKNDAIQKRHWDEIMKLSGHKWRMDPDVFCLRDLVEADLLKSGEEILDIAQSSTREADIEKKYQSLCAEWKDVELKFAEFKHRGPIILKGDDTFTTKEGLEESALAVNSMLASRYCDFMRDDIKQLLDKLVGVSETLGLWVEVQSTWMYLEAVFAGGDIMKQLPQEAKRFATIDKAWTKIMNKANEQKNLLDFCYENELLQNLPNLKDSLEECQRKLSAYLESKRNCFPRFYFVSDSVLLEILSQASDPAAIQPHLSSIFDGVASVTLEKPARREPGTQPYWLIKNMRSLEQDQLPLKEHVACVGNVEDWLERLCQSMFSAVRGGVKDAIGELSMLMGNTNHFQNLIDNFLPQAVLLLLQMQWTADVANCILQRYKIGKPIGEKHPIVSETTKKIDNVKTWLIRYTTSPELETRPRRFRTNVETLITIQVHQEEVWKEGAKPLIHVASPTSFDWLRQTRFQYKEEKDIVLVSIADSDTDYCNEYLGVKERLVVTDLTDRCYITLSQAVSMYMGGAPAGPAGTGKTETTKDLARTFGKYCVVFNCGPEQDRAALGKIIRGLSQSNAWGCFDEFNRIELPVLSVVAQQVNCVLQALKQHKTEFTFIDGQSTILKPGVGFFITMNPGYAGRQELPENLKILFRGVTMMVPDRKVIMKVKLASQGYLQNKPLSEKFFALYKLCEEQLSKQRHYDFGLRNILSVLRTAGDVLRKNGVQNIPPEKRPDKEEWLFMRTLRDMNLSKFVYEDIDLFGALIEDMFPGRSADPNVYPEIEPDLDALIKEKGLQIWPEWRRKIIQLYETKKVRHGIMVVGPALCGKTVVYDCLTETLCKVPDIVPCAHGAKVAHVQLRMNPKGITAPQMFGRIDALTGDWHDGVFAALWRRAARLSNPMNGPKAKVVWLVCDGPVDTLWIENLNTVLDDNKLLTLASGDRILMTENMKLCIEVHNLRNASPATVSRAGIIYISDVILGWIPVIVSRLKARSGADGTIRPTDIVRCCHPGLADKLLPMFVPGVAKDGGDAEKHTMVRKLTGFIEKEFQKEIVMTTSICHQVLNAFTICVALGEEISNADAAITDELANQVFWFSLAWAFGGMLEGPEREKLDANFIRQHCKSLPATENSTIYDFKLNVKSGQWEHWNKFVEKWKYPGDYGLDFSTLFIPTLDSARAQYIIQCGILQRKPVLLMGVSGTAKTVTLEKFLGRIKFADPRMSDCNFRKICFSSMTSPQNFYSALDDMVEKMGPNFGPKGGGQLAVFIDDINMPDINNWGDQVTNELVRQVVEGLEYCSLEKGAAGDKKRLRYLLFCGAMSHPTGGKNDIPDRLKRHFYILNMPLPDVVSIQQIFGSIIDSRFERDYSAQVQSVASQLTKMTIHFWRKIRKEMLPTPSSFHYFFNLRDLSLVTQGLCLIGMHDQPDKRKDSRPSEILKDATTLVAAWRHECTRVFSDKLNEGKHKQWFDTNSHDTVVQFLGKDMAEATKDPVYFVNFLRPEIRDPETQEIMEEAPKIYEPAPSLEVVQDRLYHHMQAHNETPIGKVKKLDLVLFDAAMKHVGRVSRVLALPRGNMVMVGVGGSGKQSLTRLATFIADFDYAQVQISKGFGQNQLFDAIREQYMNSAAKRPVAMVFTDNEIKQESFLEYINSFLSTGEIPGLFAPDQRDAAIGEMRPIGKKDPAMKGIFEETPDFLWRYFINRVRDRLHFILCFSPGDKFRTRARKFPGLIATCTINWFFDWPEKALLSVCERTIENFTMETDDRTRDALRDMMASVHAHMVEKSEEYRLRYRRSVFSTPKSYLSFLSSFTTVYKQKFDELNVEAKKINNGLKKLQQAADDVRVMRAQLQEKEALLGVKRKETEALVKEIEVRTAEAEVKRVEVEKVKERVAADAARVGEQEADAARDLAKAEPTLLEAIRALDSITQKDFNTLKALPSPPALIKRIFDGVVILLHMPMGPPGAEMQAKSGRYWITDSWDLTGKSVCSDSKTLDTLANFGKNKKDYINEETCELLLPYLYMEEFTRERAYQASGNIAGLCTWVRAMYNYINIAKEVAPKKERARVMQQELRAATRKREVQEEELAKVTAEVARFNQSFEAENAKKMELEEDASNCRKRMDSANGLIDALSGERERWTSQSNEFKDLIKRLVGDVAISCAFISYCGPFNADFRSQLLSQTLYAKCKQLRIPVTENLNVVKFLVEETLVNDWQLEGLPADDHSVQNAIMITTSAKYPLLVDPQGQALSWLRHRTEKEGAKVCQMTDKKFWLVFQESLHQGKPLIIENMAEEVDTTLDPLLDKQIKKMGKFLTVKIQDQEMSYDEKFYLYMTTKIPNPSFVPELFAKCLVIDFAVTQQGLEQQLLSRTIGKEAASLNEESAKLSEEINYNEKRRRNLEDRLLKQLSESQGNLIDDYTLIETLQETKDASAEIKEKLATATENRKRIAAATEEFRAVAIRGSVLYFLVNEMSLVNHMYQTSLAQFVGLFDHTLDTSERPANQPGKRVPIIIEHLTWGVFSYMVRGLFSAHKVMFVLMMTCKIELRNRRLESVAFDTLLKGGAGYSGPERQMPNYSWLSSRWLAICAISEACPKAFRNLIDSFTRNEKLWKEWIDHATPESAEIPELEGKLDSFERMLLVRAMRVDRTLLAAGTYVGATLGKDYAQPQQLDLQECVEEVNPTNPIIFLLSQGSDPTTTIEAAMKKAHRHWQRISMGQGQEARAREIVEECWKLGQWALLENCHLGIPFLIQLEDMLRNVILGGEEAPKYTLHEDARIFITAEPSKEFPIGLLQMSIKLTNEPPQGIRAGIVRSLSWMSQDVIEAFRRPDWKPLLFTQCFLHSVVQERRKFGSIGFAVPYEFNQGDWLASMQFLQNHLTLLGEDHKKNPASWETIRYMISQIQYGGRITDNNDRILFDTIALSLFDPKVLSPAPDSEYYLYSSFRDNVGNTYGLPLFEELPKYKEFVGETYPENDPPEVFNMGANADITYRTKQATKVVDTIIDCQPRGAGAASGDAQHRLEDTVDKLLLEFAEKWKPSKKERLSNKEPLTVFASQEIDRLAVVIRTIQSTCNDLKLAWKGKLIFSPALMEAAQFLGNARVPPTWIDCSWPSSDVTAWVNDVKLRKQQLDHWAVRGRPQHYWLPGFFNPQGFLTAVRQEITRSYNKTEPIPPVKWALEKVEARFEVLKYHYSEGMEAPDMMSVRQGEVLIYGLFLDGAGWQTASQSAPGKLIEQPKGEGPQRVPVMKVGADNTEAPRDRPDAGVGAAAAALAALGNQKKNAQKVDFSYKCPLYKYFSRTDNNFICYIPMPCGEKPDKWCLMGACLLGSTDTTS